MQAGVFFLFSIHSARTKLAWKMGRLKYEAIMC